jgi:general secretion pathway protein K
VFLRQAISAAKRLRCERGVALIAVLAFLAVMSLIVAGVVGSARTVATGASRALLRAQAQAAVESGIDYAIGELVNAKGFAPSLVSKPETIEVGGFRVTVSARSEHTKIDLNYADNNLLTILFRAGGADAERAGALADAVEDWRDGDDLVHVNGAERRQYEDAGFGYGPANKFFTNPDELRLVFGMSQALYDCVRPQVTVLSQRPGIDIDHAISAIRAAAGAEPTALAPAQVISPGEPFEITARLEDTKRGVSRAERAVVRLTGNPSDPYWVLGTEPAHPLDEAAARACPKPASDN